MNVKVLKLTAKRDKVKFSLLLPELNREVEVKLSQFRSLLEHFARGVRIAYLKTLAKAVESSGEEGEVDLKVVNSGEMAKNFPMKYGIFELEGFTLQLGKDAIASSIRYTIEKDIRDNLKKEMKAISIKSVPIIARVHVTKNHPYEKAFEEVFRIFEVSEPDEKDRVKVRIGVKLFKQVEVEGRKVTPLLLVETVMKLRKRDKDYPSINSYYQILRRIDKGRREEEKEREEGKEEKRKDVYRVAYAGLSYKEGSGLSLLISYKVPVVATEKGRENILGIDLGQACPVYWCVITPELEEKKLTNGKHPRGRLEYPVNLKGAIRKLWRARRNLLSSLRRINEQIKVLAENRKDMKEYLLKQKRRKVRNLEGMRRKEKKLMKKMDEFLANEVIRVALREGCGRIRMEKLEDIDKTELYFPKWNYGQLQSLIEQRASLYGIEVEKVNPYKTSQRCPSCGYIGQKKEEVRPRRDLFRCPKCGKEFSADFVGAFNVGIGGWEAFKPKRR